MNNVKSYKEFNEELNWKNAIAGAALGAGLAFSSPAKSQTNSAQSTTQVSNTFNINNFTWQKSTDISENEMNNFTESDVRKMIGQTFYVLSKYPFIVDGFKEYSTKDYTGKKVKLIDMIEESKLSYKGAPSKGYFLKLEVSDTKEVIYYEYNRVFQGKYDEKNSKFSSLALVNSQNNSLLSVDYDTSTKNYTEVDNSYIGDFKWSKIDTLSKNKSTLFNDSKMFIAKNFKSSDIVNMSEDKDLGIIYIKVKNMKNMGKDLARAIDMPVYDFVYTYNLTIKVKDNKYKITIDDVKCESSTQHKLVSNSTDINLETPKIDPFDDINSAPDWLKTGHSKKKVTNMMLSLKGELQSVINNYSSYISTSISKDDF